MYHHQDFKVYEYRSTARPELEQWQIRVGKTIVISTYRDYEAALLDCEHLNIDPWFFDRDQRRQRDANY